MNKTSAKDRNSSNSDTRQLAIENAKKHRQSGDEPLPRDKPGHTTPSQAEEQVPRLPHERDESVDSQAGGVAGELPSAEHSRQAFEDVERGLVNTDRGLEGKTLVDDTPSSARKKRDHPPI